MGLLQQMQGKICREPCGQLFQKTGFGERCFVKGVSHSGVSRKAHFLCLPQVVCLGWDFLRAARVWRGVWNRQAPFALASCHLFVGVASPGGCLELLLWLLDNTSITVCFGPVGSPYC